jgi:hypothetical protein
LPVKATRSEAAIEAAATGATARGHHVKVIVDRGGATVGKANALLAEGAPVPRAGAPYALFIRSGQPKADDPHVISGNEVVNAFQVRSPLDTVGAASPIAFNDWKGVNRQFRGAVDSAVIFSMDVEALEGMSTVGIGQANSGFAGIQFESPGPDIAPPSDPVLAVRYTETFGNPVVTDATEQLATAIGTGAMCFDEILDKPIWSNGTIWVDAAGTTA